MARIIGTTKNDFINGTPENDLIRGLKGNDTINGLLGEDLLYGGKGNDIINGNASNDTLLGKKGNDTLIGEGGNDVLYGGAGSDTLTGEIGKDRVVLGRLGFYKTTGGRTQADADVIQDFEPGTDAIALDGGLNFGDLFIFNDEGNAVISDLLTGQFLAVVEGVDAEELSFSNFTTIVQPIGRYSDSSTSDPDKIDAGIPGFVGADGDGKVTPNNVINPIFVAWATDVVDYSPTVGVEDPWRSPEKAL